ncbi:sensor histidine kinase [Nocardia sp. CS682]|uniref:sensor histidine kinase n=1 Tax=Nocardia sp. CS682 TaxID=1047172 RepID=UPI00107558CE|nr:sensor histidine kinase [Nocardia sp. CS682]QBS44852.1 two-component sensor histidine kinase [Nocardia sp. CS682]
MNIRMRQQWRLPALLATSVFVFVVVDHTLLSDTTLGARPSTGFALIQALAIVLQIRLPRIGWAASLTAVGCASVVVRESLWVDAMFNSYLVVLGILALRVSWRSAVAAWAATTALSLVLALTMPHTRLTDAVESVLLTGLVLVAGSAIRALFQSRRDALAQSAESERQRERNAVLEERTRIARELHDVVAHHMSVVAIQAGAAQHRVADPSPELLAGLEAIQSSAAAALGEMRRILGVLRADSDAPTHPQPCLDDVNELVDGVRAAGRSVTLTLHGTARDLPPGMAVSAYRIVQEALSNALRHAPTAAITVELCYRETELTLDIRNAPGGSAGPVTHGAGQGLIGMRERVAMLNGSFDAGPTPEGGYHVHARLPLDGRSPRDDPGTDR